MSRAKSNPFNPLWLLSVPVGAIGLYLAYKFLVPTASAATPAKDTLAKLTLQPDGSAVAPDGTTVSKEEVAQLKEEAKKEVAASSGAPVVTVRQASTTPRVKKAEPDILPMGKTSCYTGQINGKSIQAELIFAGGSRVRGVLKQEGKSISDFTLHATKSGEVIRYGVTKGVPPLLPTRTRPTVSDTAFSWGSVSLTASSC